MSAVWITLALVYALVQCAVMILDSAPFGLDQVWWTVCILVLGGWYTCAAAHFAPLHLFDVRRRQFSMSNLSPDERTWVQGITDSRRALDTRHHNFRRVAPRFCPYDARTCVECMEPKHGNRIVDAMNAITDKHYENILSLTGAQSLKEASRATIDLTLAQALDDEFQARWSEMDAALSPTFACPRTRHCKECNTCRLVFNHHCAFVDQCINVSTYPSYICYMISSTVLMTVMSALTLAKIMTAVHDDTLALWYQVSLFVQLLLAVGIGSFVGFQLLAQVPCLISNRDMADVIRAEHTDSKEMWGPWDYRRVHGLAWGLVLNLRWRVADMSHDVLNPSWSQSWTAVLDTFACYLVPLYWLMSRRYLDTLEWEVTNRVHQFPNMETWKEHHRTHASTVYNNLALGLAPVSW